MVIFITIILQLKYLQLKIAINGVENNLYGYLINKNYY